MFDSKTAKRLAELSRIRFTAEELEKMTADMTDIIALMDRVCDFDSEVEPYSFNAVNFKELRDDIYEPSYDTDKIMANAKNVKSNCFSVPKVV